MNESSEREAILTGLRTEGEKEIWSAASQASEYVDSQPDFVWSLIEEFGSSGGEEVRMAVATCMLEHLLEKMPDTYLPRVRKKNELGDELFRDTFRLCWKLAKNLSETDAELRDVLAGNRLRK